MYIKEKLCSNHVTANCLGSLVIVGYVYVLLVNRVSKPNRETAKCSFRGREHRVIHHPGKYPAIPSPVVKREVTLQRNLLQFGKCPTRPYGSCQCHVRLCQISSRSPVGHSPVAF